MACLLPNGAYRGKVGAPRSDDGDVYPPFPPETAQSEQQPRAHLTCMRTSHLHAYSITQTSTVPSKSTSIIDYSLTH